ncbi:ABC transporter permease subunit [Gorillibacterium sp. sgz500922]|uniref:ABC transporter permease subunit n=1 Tax=Gorillibacterium sp. sgz500922 TaxID=3446694 RepID=UPI003F6798A0
MKPIRTALVTGFCMLLGIFLFSQLGHALKPTVADDQLRVPVKASVLHSIPEKHPETTVVQDGNERSPGILQIPRGQTAEYADLLNREYGVRETFPVEGPPTFSLSAYGRTLSDTLKRFAAGDWGELTSGFGSPGRPAKEIPLAGKLGGLMATTLRYLLPALAFAVFAGTAGALVASFHPRLGRLFDGVHAILLALPDFVVVCLLQLLCIFLVGQFHRPMYLIVEFNGRVPFFIPFVAIALVPGALVYGTLRIAVRREWAEDYIVTARSKGLGRSGVIVRHVFRNVADDLFAALPKATGLAVAAMVMAEVLCQIFGLGGLLDHPRYYAGDSLVTVCLVLGLVTFGLNLFYAVLKRLLHVGIREASAR